MAEHFQVTTFNPDDIKQKLISFLQSTQFKDFNYEGSSINVIIDLLTRNDHYSAFLANMLANESFIGSAEIYSNVVAHAQQHLSYTPLSCTAASVSVDILVTPGNTDSLAPTIVMEQGSTFMSNVDGKAYSFTNMSSTVLYLQSDNTYKATGVQLHQGQIIKSKRFHNKDATHEIPNERIDTSTLSVVVADSQAINNERVYNKVDSIVDVSADDHVYYLSQNQYGKYEFEFGRDILSVEPRTNSVVSITYILTESDHANGIKKMFCATPISGYSNIVVSNVEMLVYGEEKEDIESIRFTAPRAKATQNRGVVETDYETIVRQRFPFVRYVKAWGGEKNNPPVYGTTFFSVIPKSGDLIANSVKREIEAGLSEYNVGPIKVKCIDPMRFGLDLTIYMSYDNRKTSKSFNDLQSVIVEHCKMYDKNYLNNFDQSYKQSELNSDLKGIQGIVDIEIDKRVFFELNPTRTLSYYDVDFANQIEPSTVLVENFSLDLTAGEEIIRDDGVGNLVYYKTVGESVSERILGSVDYINGTVNFRAAFNSKENVKVSAKFVRSSFHAINNRVLYINKVNTILL